MPQIRKNSYYVLDNERISMIPGSKGHVFRACTKKHDFGTQV